MIVVSDASPLISLAEIGHLETLPRLYRSIMITPEVYSEVTVAGHGLAGALQVATAAWIQIRSAQPAPTRFSLGLGELSTIALAREVRADLTLIDDRHARRLAETEGLSVLGCVGVLETAFRHGVINDLTAA